MKLYFPITVDLYNPHPLPRMNAQQHNVGRGAIITLTANGQVIVPDEETVRIFAKRPDKNVSYLDCSIVEGKIQADFTDQMLATEGNVEVELELATTETNITTPIFIVEVNKSNVKEGVQSSNEYKALEKYTAEAKEAAEQAQEVYDNIPNYEANLIVSKASGEVITTTDSAKVKPKNIKLFGKGKQRQYEGNQLLQYPYVSTSESYHGITTTDNGDGSITFTGTNNNTSSDYYYNLFLFEGSRLKLKAGTYTVSTLGLVDGLIFQFHLEFTNRYIVNGETFTITEDDEANVYVIILSGKTVNTTIYPMLNEGTQALPWEPYVGNEPSPNMNYPQKVESHGESGSIGGKVLNKNLYGGRYYYIGYANGVGYIEREDDVVLPFEPISETQGIAKIIPCLKGQTYTMFVDNPNENCSYGIAEYESIESAFSTTNKIDYLAFGGYSKASSYTAKQNGILLCGVSGKWTNGSTTIHVCTEDENVQVELGDVATEYEAPATEQPFTFQTPNGLRGIPLGQIIPDAIKNSPIHMSGVYRDERDGLYYICDTKNEDGKDVQRIVKIPMNNIHFASHDTFIQGSTVIGGITNNIERCGLCTHAKYVGMLYGNVKGFGIQTINGDTFFQFGEIMTIDEFNSIKNDIFVWTWLDEPIITDTTEEEKAQLDSLVMNYPNTTVVNDAGAYMEVEYVADTKMYVDESKKELEERIDEIVIEGGGDVDLSGYATKKYVDDLVGNIKELLGGI